VTLSYLATGFDWRAKYVAKLAPDGERLELRAWLTLASGDETSFPDARTQAVAGRLNWSGERAPPVVSRPLTLDCWPQSTTSDIPEIEEQIVVTGSRIRSDGFNLAAAAPPPPPPPPPPAPPAMMAEQESLGALKLYRIPEPVTVAAHAQKQVALLARPSVRVRSVYRRWIQLASEPEPSPASRVLVTRNLASEGLGLPLPAGDLILFSSGGARPVLLGEGSVGDHAVGEAVELEFGSAPGVMAQVRSLTRKPDAEAYELVVTNDRPEPIAFEALFGIPANRVAADMPLVERRGRPAMAFEVPANGSRTIGFRPVPAR
jgi:hypothetical protein